MSDDQIKWVVTADDKDVIAAFKRMQKELEATRKKQSESNEESKKAERQAKEQAKAAELAQRQQQKGMDQGIATLAKMAFGWAGVQTAIRLTTAEYQNYLELQDRSADATIRTANAQMKFFRNLGDVTKEEAAGFVKAIKATAAAGKTSEENVYTIATAARSSQGSLTDAQMLANIGMGARLGAGDVGEMTAIAGGLNTTSRLTGSADPEVNAGFLLGIGKQARPESMVQIASTLVPSAIGVKATLPETSVQSSAAAYATLSMLSDDRTGAETATNMQKLAAQLRKVRGGTNLDAEITALQNDEKARAEFFKKAPSFERYQPFVEQLLTGGTDAAAMYSQNRNTVPVGDKAKQSTRRFFENLGAEPYQRAADLDRAFKASSNALLLDNQGGSMKGISREGLMKELANSGQSSPAQLRDRMLFDFQTGIEGKDPAEVAIGRIQNRIDNMRGTTGQTNKTFRRNEVAADPEVEKQARILEALLVEIRGMRTDQKGVPKPKNVDVHTE